MTLPRVAISLGDPSGIGPEVTAAALADRRVARALVPVVFGDARLFARAAKTMGVADGLSKADPGSKRGWLVGGLGGEKSRPGRPDREGALAQLAYLDAAASSLEEGLCTGALHGAALQVPGDLPRPPGCISRGTPSISPSASRAAS